ncbi:hypothetical protein D9M71_711750 [compost metagenome]
MLALALQEVDELVELFDEGQGAGLESRGITTLQGRVEGLLPVILQPLVAVVELCVAAVVKHCLECLAIETLLQALADVGDFCAVGTRGQFPAQAVGFHAHRACGIDRRGIALAEPGDQAGAQRARQCQYGNQNDRQTSARG